MESTYLEESSNSSEMFLPKKVSKGARNVAVPPSADSSSKSSQSHTCSQCYKSSPRKRKQQSRSLVTEVKSSVYKEETPVHSQKNLGNGNDLSKLVDQNNGSGMSCSKLTSISDGVNFSSSSSKSESRSLSYQNWKEDKTYSEKIMESNFLANGNGDSVHHVAIKERENNIKLINDKLKYLENLKNDLQKHDVFHNTSKKCTAVYIVSDENDQREDHQRKYTIETNVSSDSSRHKKFKIGDKKYSVKEVSKSPMAENEIENLPSTLSDIEVVTTKDGLNIKVTTVCEDCGRTGCVCKNTGSYINKLKQTTVPTNDNNAPYAAVSNKSHDSSCSCCHRYKNKPNLLLREKHCPLCNVYDCGCVAKISGESDAIAVKQKADCFKKKSDSTLPVTKIPATTHFPVEAETTCICKVCLKIPCQCDSSDQSGSLKRVFENCTCKSKFTCDCDFVNKLYRHFKSSNELKSNWNKPKTDDIHVQTESNLVSTEAQAIFSNDLLNGKHEELNNGTVGVQCRVEMQHAVSQMTRDFKSCACQTSDDVTLPVKIADMVKSTENLGIQVAGPITTERASQVDNIIMQSSHQQTDDIIHKPENIKDPNFRKDEKGVQESNGSNSKIEISEKSRIKSTESSRRSSKSEEKKINNQQTTQTIPSVMNSGTSSTVISQMGNGTSATYSSSSIVTCICCKKVTDKKEISFYRYDREEYPLCCMCIKKKPILTSVCYSGPRYVCRCYEPSEISVEPQEYCTCIKPSQYKNTRYCAHCQFKLRKTLKSKNGIAYTLTLEYDSQRRHKSKKSKKRELEEIKVKIPGPYSRKKTKDQENFIRKEQMTPVMDNKTVDSTNNMVDSNDSTKVDNKIVDSTNEEDRQSESVPNNEDQKIKVRRNLTLQEHLIKNRPDFIDSAEYRRHILLNFKQVRELRKDDVKIKFLEENALAFKNNRPILFTEREMREITKKNYKKLPEVQQKLKNNRERILRNADKFIVNTLTKRIQKNILKGRSTFPIDTNIVDVYK